MRNVFLRVAAGATLASLTLFPLTAIVCWSAEPLTVGSKKFTESVVLGELVRQLSESSGTPAHHRSQLGGTRILWNALESGEIDVYPEYTGTLEQELLPGIPRDRIQEKLADRGLRMSAPLGFNNTYAIGMAKERARSLSIRKLSDLRKHPDLRLGLSSEFMDRADGWPRVRAKYRLPQKTVRGLDHDLAYRALESSDIDAIDLYSTDAEIEYYDLITLEDDLGVFPRYDAILLYRADLERTHPAALRGILSLEGKISEGMMTSMNSKAKLKRIQEGSVASEFLASELGVEAKPQKKSTATELALTRLWEHLSLVSKSMLAAILVAIPLGIWSARSPGAGHLILTIIGMIQTVPALALLVMLIQPLKLLGLPGIGDTPAIVALFLYSLLPIVRNTHVGLRGIPSAITESAEALGLTPMTRLRRVEIPLASPMILAGIKTATVINVGFATLGALIGAGGFGQPILTGIRLDDYGLILQGAVPAALLALAFQALFDLSEKFWVPRGLRLK